MEKVLNTQYNLTKNLSNNLHSDFDKLFNLLNSIENMENKEILLRILKINSSINNLQNEIHDLKIQLLKSKNKTIVSNDITELLSDEIKDNLVLEYFKPLIIYYRMLLD